MKCEVDCCIFNKDFECILQETQINSVGMCDEFLMIPSDKKFLESEKEKQLKESEDGQI